MALGLLWCNNTQLPSRRGSSGVLAAEGRLAALNRGACSHREQRGQLKHCWERSNGLNLAPGSPPRTTGSLPTFKQVTVRTRLQPPILRCSRRLTWPGIRYCWPRRGSTAMFFQVHILFYAQQLLLRIVRRDVWVAALSYCGIFKNSSQLDLLNPNADV